MANLIYTLSARVTNGTSEVMVRFTGGRGYDQRAHSRVRVPIHLWDADNHCLIVNKRYVSEDTILAADLQRKLDTIEQIVLSRFIEEKHLFAPGWLQRVIDECTPRSVTILPVRIDKACIEYSGTNGLEPGTQRQYLALSRILARYCEEINPIHMNAISTDDLDSLYRFFRRWNGEEVSHNTIAAKMRKVRAICYWAQRKGMMEKCPFSEGYTIKQEVYGTPTTLSMQEVEHIYRTPMPSDHLTTQRDIFVFQCFVGQRISDLCRMTASNIITTTSGLALQYMQKKTRKQTPRVTEVPLSKIAVEIIERYAGRLDGKILPFIAEQNYNYAIKDILREAGVTRLVPVLNTTTFAEEMKSICEIASSHLARRTFTSNIFEITQDERLTISLTGHAEGSRALSRYIKITDKTKRSVIDRLEGK
jgi:integrase